MNGIANTMDFARANNDYRREVLKRSWSHREAHQRSRVGLFGRRGRRDSAVLSTP